MAKAKKEVVVESSARAELLALIKAKAPAIFEREVNSGFATGNLEKLVDDILALLGVQ